MSSGEIPCQGCGCRAKGYSPAFSNTIKSTLRQCGIDNWKDYSGHGLRASAACELLEAGCNESLVAAITGHKDLKVLRRYLEEVNQEKRVLKAMDPPLGYSKLIALRVRVSPKNKALLATTKSANRARKPR
jgi:integrase